MPNPYYSPTPKGVWNKQRHPKPLPASMKDRYTPAHYRKKHSRPR